MSASPPPRPPIHPHLHPHHQPNSHNPPNRPFAVYFHANLSDPTGTAAILAAQAPDFNSAYVALIQHAGTQVGNRPDWGSTQQGTRDHVYEVSTWDRSVVMRYSIELLRDADMAVGHADEEGATSIALQEPDEHYGLFITTYDDGGKGEEKEKWFISGAKSLGEAGHAMKVSAAAYIDIHGSEDVQLLEKSVEVRDAKGGVRQRYEIVQGRMVEGKFVTEEKWRMGDVGGEVVGPTREMKKMKTETAMKPEQRLETKVSGTTRGPLVQVERLRTPKFEVERFFVEDTESAQEPVSAQPPETHTPPAETAPDVERWCTCRGTDDGRLMVCCDNDACPIQWYHVVCLGRTRAPEGEWLCPRCAPPSRGGRERLGRRLKRGGRGRRGRLVSLRK